MTSFAAADLSELSALTEALTKAGFPKLYSKPPVFTYFFMSQDLADIIRFVDVAQTRDSSLATITGEPFKKENTRTGPTPVAIRRCAAGVLAACGLVTSVITDALLAPLAREEQKREDMIRMISLMQNPFPVEAIIKREGKIAERESAARTI